MSTRTGVHPGIGWRTRPVGHGDRGLWGLVSILLTLFILLATWVASGHALPFDQSFYQRLSQPGNPTLTHLAWLAVGLASACVNVVPVTALALFATRQRRRAVAVAASGLGALALNLTLKDFFHRTRPGEVAPAYLFPSTHMVLTVVVYGMITCLIGMGVPRPLRWLVICLAMCLVVWVGLSLVYLDQHYLTDVIGGLLIGGAWLCVSLAMLGRVTPESR